MASRIDLVGQRFGKLVVTGYAGERAWDTRCDCGTMHRVLGRSLRLGLTKSCGCAAAQQRAESNRHPRAAYKEDITGRRFGSLVVTGQAPALVIGPKRSYGMWWVRCDCGVEKAVKRVALNGGLKSCGCGKSLPLPDQHGLKNRVVSRYRKQASQRGYAWGLSFEEAADLLSRDCHYCGAAPAGTVRTNAEGQSMAYNGIDRVDNTRGYIPGNVVPCCGLCNRVKSDMTYGEFAAYAQRLADHHPALRGALEGAVRCL